jgi:hypothetical protein
MPTHTRDEFRQNGITLELTFLTPAIMSDLDLLSRPVTYLTWSIQATDGEAAVRPPRFCPNPASKSGHRPTQLFFRKGIGGGGFSLG